MASTDYQPPDLASVLATLATYAPPQPSAYQHPTPHPQPPPIESDLEEGEYDPSDFKPSISQPSNISNSALESRNPAPPPTASPQARPSQTRTSQLASAPIESVSKIISWPPALRHVMKTIVSNPAISHQIQHLIRTQHQHERQWWSGRESLLKKQKGREEGRKKLDDVL